MHNYRPISCVISRAFDGSPLHTTAARASSQNPIDLWATVSADQVEK